MTDWEINFDFHLQGEENGGGEGLAFWFTQKKMLGPVFGAADFWNGRLRPSFSLCVCFPAISICLLLCQFGFAHLLPLTFVSRKCVLLLCIVMIEQVLDSFLIPTIMMAKAPTLSLLLCTTMALFRIVHMTMQSRKHSQSAT